MTLAPIWSMRPMSNSLIYDVPVRLLAPSSREIWDMDESGSAQAGQYHGRGLTDQTRPSGLAFDQSDDPDKEAWFQALLAEKHIFRDGSFLFVSGAVCEALKGIDLGIGQFTKMPIYHKDRKTEFDADFYLLDFSSVKDTVDRDNTPRCRPLNKGRPEAGYLLASDLTGKDVFVHPAAQEGADLWFDPMIRHVQFVSDRMAQACIGLGLQDALILNQCKFLDA